MLELPIDIKLSFLDTDYRQDALKHFWRMYGTSRQNYRQGASMALNGWSIQNIQAFSIMLNIPEDVTVQIIDGYMNTLKKPYYSKRTKVFVNGKGLVHKDK